MTVARLRPGTFWSGGKEGVVSIELSGVIKACPGKT